MIKSNIKSYNKQPIRTQRKDYKWRLHCDTWAGYIHLKFISFIIMPAPRLVAILPEITYYNQSSPTRPKEPYKSW